MSQCTGLGSCLVGAGLPALMECARRAHYCTPTIATAETLRIGTARLPLFDAGTALYATDHARSYAIQPQHGRMLVVPHDGPVETLDVTRRGTEWLVERGSTGVALAALVVVALALLYV